MKARMGTPKAMTATAHKLARIIFHMITTQQPYDTTFFQKQEERRQHQKSARLHAQARELGFQLIPINVVPKESRGLYYVSRSKRLGRGR
jgi:hypothetical protein